MFRRTGAVNWGKIVLSVKKSERYGKLSRNDLSLNSGEQPQNETTDDAWNEGNWLGIEKTRNKSQDINEQCGLEKREDWRKSGWLETKLKKTKRWAAGRCKGKEGWSMMHRVEGGKGREGKRMGKEWEKSLTRSYRNWEWNPHDTGKITCSQKVQRRI